MKAYSILILFFFSTLFPLSLQADRPFHHWEKEVALGDIPWKVEKKIRFQLKNDTPSSFRILSADSDCGCTRISFPEQAVAPDSTYEIEATYNAATLGTFSEQILVRTDADTVVRILTFSGRVLTEVRNLQKEFPYQIGDIRLSTDNVEFDDINRGEQPEKTILVFNEGKKNFVPELMHLPKYLMAYTDPEVVRPGKMGKIRLQLNSNELHTMGLTQTSVYLARYSGDKVSKDNEIEVSATLLPQTTCTEAQRIQAPVAVIDTLVDLGSFSGKKKLTARLLLTNRGKSLLKITTLQVYNPGIGVSLPKSTIKPGETIKLKISASSAFDLFRGRRRVLMITNDPSRPKITIDVVLKK